MHRIITDWDGFTAHWSAPTNFLFTNDLLRFDYDFPPLSHIVDELRQDEQAQIGSGAKSDTLTRDSIADAFRQLPIAEAMVSPFTIGHFRLSRFDHPGGCLHGFKEAVLDVWQAALRDHGFTWDRCYPIIFISGIDCATNYHMDFSHVMAWQIYGQKHFCGLCDPGRWAPREMRVQYNPTGFRRPDALTDDDALCYQMPPGSMLWNALLTPHWVEAGNEAAMSVNLSHGGLRLHGRLAPFEQELADYRAEQGLESGPVKGAY